VKPIEEKNKLSTKNINIILYKYIDELNINTLKKKNKCKSFFLVTIL